LERLVSDGLTDIESEILDVFFRQPDLGGSAARGLRDEPTLDLIGTPQSIERAGRRPKRI